MDGLQNAWVYMAPSGPMQNRSSRLAATETAATWLAKVPPCASHPACDGCQAELSQYLRDTFVVLNANNVRAVAGPETVATGGWASMVDAGADWSRVCMPCYPMDWRLETWNNMCSKAAIKNCRAIW